MGEQSESLSSSDSASVDDASEPEDPPGDAGVELPQGPPSVADVDQPPVDDVNQPNDVVNAVPEVQ